MAAGNFRNHTMNELSFRECQALSLGATMYVPGTHADLKAIVSTGKTGARSLVVCTEDAVAADDLPLALANIREALPLMMNLEDNGVQVFIRPRTPDVLRALLNEKHIENAAGFVLPKFTVDNLDDWTDALEGASPMLGIMPTLETSDVYNTDAMQCLAFLLKKGALSSRVIALRIGGNDLLNCLGLRRPRNMTIYDTPLGSTIAKLVTTFRPLGFMLTAPVFEHYEDAESLKREVALDKAHGLIGKTAIHPSQLAVIEQALAPTAMEHEEATAILAVDAPAVFKLNGSMCEPATHYHWAKMIAFLAERKTITTAQIRMINAA
jgi:citrate lyase beta subunit